MKKLIVPVLMGITAFGILGCEKKGPMERAGEEIDEAVDTIKHGEESTKNKADDAIDELRKGAEEAKKEVTN